MFTISSPLFAYSHVFMTYIAGLLTYADQQIGDLFLDPQCLYDTGASPPLIFDDDFRNLGLHANIMRPGVQSKVVNIWMANGNI